MIPNIIPGFTIGALGVWALVVMGAIAAVIWLIRTAADRKRAANEEIAIREKAKNEGVTTLSGATDAVITILTAEVKRLSEQVEKLTNQVSSLEKELHEERQAKLGVIRASAQNDISTARVLKGLGK